MGIGTRVESNTGHGFGIVIDTRHGGATLLVEFDGQDDPRWVSWAHVTY